MRLVPLLLVASLVGCVKGSPGDDVADDDDTFDTEGGSYTVAGCGFDVVTKPGAEAPQESGETLGAEPSPFHVHLGFGGDPRTTIAMLWRTDIETDVSIVNWGEGTALDRTAEGLTFRYIAGFGGIGDTVRMHEVHLCGLTPDTEYSYQVGAEGALSPTYTFRTAPDIVADPSATVRVGIVGDSRNGEDVWEQIATEMDALGVDLLMYSGDAVTIGQIQPEWDAFFDAAGDLPAHAPFISAMGNHDLNSVNYFSQFAMPGDESDYAFDFGHARMTIVNDSPTDVGHISGRTRQFLDEDLAGTSQVWKVVNQHRPLWSSGTSHGGDSQLLAEWGPVYDQHHADIVIAGHDHIYERTHPMFGQQAMGDPAQGTVYVVTGGAGADLYGVDPDQFWTAVAESTHGFGIVTIGPTMLHVEMYRPGENLPLLDDFTLVK